VYSLNKAGKDIQHRPVINPNGGYNVLAVIQKFLNNLKRSCSFFCFVPYREKIFYNKLNSLNNNSVLINMS